jgi:hypothetical protein
MVNKSKKKHSIFGRKSKKSKMMRRYGGQFNKFQPVVSNQVIYKDPIFDETITYSTKCSDNKDEEYRKKREAFANALKDEDHPCNIGTQKDKKRPSQAEIEECEKRFPEYKNDECKRRIPTQSQIDECNRQRQEVMDEPCGVFLSKAKCIAGNAGQVGNTIRRFRGEPVRIKNQHLKETDKTQNYDEFGETMVSKYCDKYKQKVCEMDRIPVDTAGKRLNGSWDSLQKYNFKCAKKESTGTNKSCINGWGVRKGATNELDCNIHGMLSDDLEEPSQKTEMNEIQNQLNKIQGGYKKNRRVSRKLIRS